MDKIFFMASFNLMIGFPSPSIDDVIRQLINIRILIIREVDVQGFTDLTDDPGDAFRIVLFVKMEQDDPDPIIPEFAAYLLMNTLVPIQRQLPVFQGHINQHSIPLRRLIHFQPGKDLRRPVQRIDESATAFHEDADLTAGLMLRPPYGGDDLLIRFRGQQWFTLEEGYSHAII
jgi:hypothetical protein